MRHHRQPPGAHSLEANLQQLAFTGVNEARQFEKALKRKVREMITMEKEEVAA